MFNQKFLPENMTEIVKKCGRYFDLGWEIFPCILYVETHVSSTGVTRKKRMKSIGQWKSKIYDKEIFKSDISDLWKRYGGFNSIACKTCPSRLLVVDIDNKDEKIFSSSTWMIRSLICDEIKKPIYAETQSNGFHYYFTAPKKCQKRAFHNLGIDIQCENSLIYLPPSSVLYGGTYNWVNEPQGRPPVVPEKLYRFMYAERPEAEKRPTGPSKLIRELSEKQISVLKDRIYDCKNIETGSRSEKDFALIAWMRKLNLNKYECETICRNIGRKFSREDYFLRTWEKCTV